MHPPLCTIPGPLEILARMLLPCVFLGDDGGEELFCILFYFDVFYSVMSVVHGHERGKCLGTCLVQAACVVPFAMQSL